MGSIGDLFSFRTQLLFPVLRETSSFALSPLQGGISPSRDQNPHGPLRLVRRWRM